MPCNDDVIYNEISIPTHALLYNADLMVGIHGQVSCRAFPDDDTKVGRVLNDTSASKPPCIAADDETKECEQRGYDASLDVHPSSVNGAASSDVYDCSLGNICVY